MVNPNLFIFSLRSRFKRIIQVQTYFQNSPKKSAGWGVAHILNLWSPRESPSRVDIRGFGTKGLQLTHFLTSGTWTQGFRLIWLNELKLGVKVTYYTQRLESGYNFFSITTLISDLILLQTKCLCLFFFLSLQRDTTKLYFIHQIVVLCKLIKAYIRDFNP